MIELTPILTIAQRDVAKFLRDRARIVATLLFPVIFIGILGGTFRSNLNTGYDYLTFVFTGVFAQNLFQSTAAGLVSLIEDRENDFSQEMFVAPISRYSIVFGKILGESLVSLTLGAGIVAFGVVLGVPLPVPRLLSLVPVGLAVAIAGGAFGVVVLSNLRSQRSANQIFPFLIFPQFFLAGVFAPIRVLPWYLDVLSRLTPMRYAVDLVRDVYYAGSPAYRKVVLAPAGYNLAVMAAMFVVFMAVGTALFVRNERNR